MTKSRIITRITPSGTDNYTGFDLDNHLDNLALEIKPVNYGDDEPDFRSEVHRKVSENFKPTKEEE